MSATPRIIALALACIFGTGGSSAPVAQVPPTSGPETPVTVSEEAIDRGRLLTSTACASCHATGRRGDSPLPDAPPLREIVQRYPLDQLEEAFAEGLVTSHPAMPQYTFRASEIDDLIAYLESLQVDR